MWVHQTYWWYSVPLVQVVTKSYDFTTIKKPRPVPGLFVCHGFCGLWARGAKHSQKSKDVAGVDHAVIGQVGGTYADATEVAEHH